MGKKNYRQHKPVVHLCVDVEATGESPMTHSMIEIGAVSLCGKEFHTTLKPLEGKLVNPRAIAAIGVTVDEIMEYRDPEEATVEFHEWLEDEFEGKRIIFWSDNPAFDWQYVNGYLHHFCGHNPMGFSARRIGDFYAGLMNDPAQSVQWKRFRKTEHTHNALDDAKGNAEALQKLFNMAKEMKK